MNIARAAQEALDARECPDTLVIGRHEAMSWIMGGISAVDHAGHAGLRLVQHNSQEAAARVPVGDSAAPLGQLAAAVAARKLGAHSRREAVRRARAAGLLAVSSRRP